MVLERAGESSETLRAEHGRHAKSHVSSCQKGSGRATPVHPDPNIEQAGEMSMRRTSNTRAVDSDRTRPRRRGAIETQATGSPRIECFRRWVRASVSTPSVREELHARVALYGPMGLPEMVEVVREIELACLTRFQALNRRMRYERREADVRDAKRRMSIEEYAEFIAGWDGRIKWLQDLRRYLEGGALPPRDRGRVNSEMPVLSVQLPDGDSPASSRSSSSRRSMRLVGWLRRRTMQLNSGGVEEMSQRDNGGARSSDGPAPLYQRLPRGPHHLGPEEVVRHQRLRMHGAMVEAVAANGYASTSVKQVIALAGVSRRVFYEQFANKQECFLATFDLIAIRAIKRIGMAYRAGTGDLRQHMAGAFAELINELVTNAKGASLTIVEAQTVGALGLFHLRRTMKTFEQMLASSFAHSPEAAELPTPIVRGIVGGVHEAVSLRLREGRADELPGLTDELVRWTLLFQAPSMPRMSACLAERARALSAQAEPVPLVLDLRHRTSGPRSSEISPTARGESRNGHNDRGEPDMPQQCRERLLQAVLDLTVLVGYHELSAPQIFEAAGVPGEVFLELFAGKEECFLAAFEEISYELLRIAADPDLVSAEWPDAVRRVIGGLMGLLATKPVYARTIATEAPGAGPKALVVRL